MRIWHESLIPKLCQKHLCAMWREGLGAYKIITENKKGYSNHPAVKEFENAPLALYERLQFIRNEMLNRNYHPKALMTPKLYMRQALKLHVEQIQPWQTLEQQIEVLKSKNCECKLESIGGE